MKNYVLPFLRKHNNIMMNIMWQFSIQPHVQCTPTFIQMKIPMNDTNHWNYSSGILHWSASHSNKLKSVTKTFLIFYSNPFVIHTQTQNEHTKVCVCENRNFGIKHTNFYKINLRHPKLLFPNFSSFFVFFCIHKSCRLSLLMIRIWMNVALFLPIFCRETNGKPIRISNKTKESAKKGKNKQ